MITPETASVLTANAAKFAQTPAPFDAGAEWRRCEARGWRVLLLGSAEYPQLLASVDDAPQVLYARGEFRHEEAACLAIVGSRRPTAYGLSMARRIATEAAGAGLVVVSGLARGIDSEAHRAALKAGGVTWGVLGSGLERPYPGENKGLIDEIARQGGAVLSEVPLDGPPMPENFPRRNRIISGLSWATVVIEGGERSGSLITAHISAEQGRGVFAVPGRADSPMSQGPIRLLYAGAARVATRLEDILEDVAPLRLAAKPRPAAETPRAPAASAREKRILELTGGEPAHLETLLRETGWGLQALSRVLLELELKGLIEEMPGQRYAKR
ncbi:MAG: DNA-protecting protein DprA [Elusimicrobia bacterium]|nr:DNA-protecting protein DprA [Elusimicrobiota bacterium]